MDWITTAAESTAAPLCSRAPLCSAQSAVTTLALAESRFDRVVSLGEQFRTQYPASPLLDQIDQHLGRGYLKQRQYAKAMRILKPLTQTASVGDLPAAAGT